MTCLKKKTRVSFDEFKAILFWKVYLSIYLSIYICIVCVCVM